MKHKDIHLNLENIALKNFTDSALKFFQYIAVNKDLQFINHISEEIFIKADKDRFTQILYNLLGNAEKFSSEGSIEVSAKKADNQIEICVSDTGIGIPKEMLEDIFISFEQVDTSIDESCRGSGLGLTITKKLVELHGGKTRAESSLGEGSKFNFSMPAGDKIGAYEALQDSSKAIFNEKVSAFEIPFRVKQNGEHILLVDDEIVNLYAAAAILKQEGYSITALTSAEEAIDLVKSDTSISLLILDVMLPKISGYEVSEEIRKYKSLYDLPILMLTAQAGVSDIVTGCRTV